MFQAKVVEKIKTHILCSVTFFFSPENHAIYEITWKNIVEPNRSKMTVRRMCITCWILKATNAHSEDVLFLAFPLQQWSHKRASMLRHTYIACLVKLDATSEIK